MRTQSICGGNPHLRDSSYESGAAALLELVSRTGNFDTGELGQITQELDHFEQPSMQRVGKLVRLFETAQRVHRNC
jgi:hypothetical protein